MRFDPDEAEALAAELAPPRRAGAGAVAGAAADRLEALLRDAGYRVARSGVPTPVERAAPPVAFALAAAGAGFALEGLYRLGRPSGPRELAVACGLLVVVGLIERRVHLGSWGGAGVTLPALRATDPRGDGAPARLVLVTPFETPAPEATRRLKAIVAALELLWLALLLVPCVLGDARDWLTQAGPGLLATLGLLSLLSALDPWARRPRPYPGDNRSGPALAVALARAWPATLAGRVALEVRIGPLDAAGPPGPESAPGRTWIAVLLAPGVGDRVAIAGREGLADGAEGVARGLWLPVARVCAGPPARVAARVGAACGATTFVLAGSGPMPADGRPDPALLRSTAQLLHELALRWSREADEAGQADRSPP
jgi:hypothetical protein